MPTLPVFLPEQQRLIEQDDLDCPAAGTALAGQGVYCKIERHTLDARKGREPTSVMNFCCGDHTACPTWRAEKERIWAERRAELVEEPE